MEDEYSCVNKSKLKIKDDSGIKKKKKKKFSKEKEKAIENEVKQQVTQQVTQEKRTKAEIAFKKMQEKMLCTDGANSLVGLPHKAYAQSMRTSLARGIRIRRVARACRGPSRALSAFVNAQKRLSSFSTVSQDDCSETPVNELDKEQCLTLIQLYRTYRLLWDSKYPGHMNKQLRDDAWRNISQEINIPKEIIKKKMESLQGSYRREKSRENNTGSGRVNTYKSKWYAYEALSFMADKNEPEPGCEQNESQCEEHNDNNQHTQDEQPVKEGRNEAVQTELLEQIPQKKNNKKKNPTKNDEMTDSCISKAFSLIQQCANNTIVSKPPNDTYSAFGHYIAEELRKYDNYTLAYVKNSICRIIFEADTGAYQQHSVYYTQPQATPDLYCSTSHTLSSASPMPSPMPSTSPKAPSSPASTSPRSPHSLVLKNEN